MSTKIHVTVDALGNPTGFHLTPGQAHDLEGADVLLSDTPAQTVIADKAYDAQARLIEPLWAKGKAVVIPSRATNRQRREYDRHLYKARRNRPAKSSCRGESGYGWFETGVYVGGAQAGRQR